jgi:hypothetical protein
MPTRRSTALAAEHGVPRVDWEDVGPEIIAHWGRPSGKNEPEHMSIYGPSGSGKSRLARVLLKERARRRGSAVVVVVTKRADKTLLTEMGWPVIRDWPPGYGEEQVIYHAPAKGISAQHLPPQRLKVKTLMDELWVPNANTVVFWDEMTYIERDLRLNRELATFYREGRSYGITNLATLQRPTGVSRLAHSEPAWSAAFRPKDQDDRKRVAEVFGDRQRFQLVLADLDKYAYEFVVYHDRTGEAYITHLPVKLRRSGRAGRRVPSRTR